MVVKLKTLSLSPTSKHLLHCGLLLTVISVFVIQLTWTDYDAAAQVDPYVAYGTLFTLFLYGLRFLALLALPQCVCNFLGLTLYNTFPEKVQLKGSPLLAPFICVRTVTRGDFPDLVRSNVNRNMKTCLDVGLENFIIEVVSDKPVNLPKHPRLREVVVPTAYKSKTGVLYKVNSKLVLG